jgi:transposase
MGYIDTADRKQSLLFPASLDEYVGENNVVRVIAAFIEHLRFEELGFVRAEPAGTGRPGYDPRILLGIFLWGHLNGVRSSRRLERECGRNVELMWLSGLLRPDFKTLCRFRQENGEAISRVLTQFRVWCEGADLLGKELVAIDGSKFKAVNSTRRNITQGKLKQSIEREKRLADRYLEELAEADAQDPGDEAELNVEELKRKLAELDVSLGEQEKLLDEMEAAGDKQRSLTDPDARLMKTAKGTDVCYNVQTAVDSKHKLIVAVEVTNKGNDLGMLPEMARQAKQDLGVDELTVVADGGYFTLESLKTCEDENITAYIPVREGKDAQRLGLIPREKFKYDEHRDVYICPAGAEMRPRNLIYEQGHSNKDVRVYKTNACRNCSMLSQCTTSKYGRKIKRWVHQALVDRLKERLRDDPGVMRRRKALVEHPFGTIKVSMNHERLLMKGLKNVSTEIKLTVLSYNFKRVISILGAETMIDMFTNLTPAPTPA